MLSLYYIIHSPIHVFISVLNILLNTKLRTKTSRFKPKIKLTFAIGTRYFNVKTKLWSQDNFLGLVVRFNKLIKPVHK